MEDSKIVDLYWQRSEAAIEETAIKYGAYCYAIALMRTPRSGAHEDQLRHLPYRHVRGAVILPVGLLCARCPKLACLHRGRHRHRRHNGCEQE